MQNEFLDRLPNDVRALVLEIENAADTQIEVKVDSERAVMACEMNHHGAIIIIPAADYFPEASVFHELLHIRRIFVEGVPRIADCHECDHVSPETITALTQLDNDLEHLYIVPEEINKYPERRKYWEERVLRALRKMPAELEGYELKRQALIKGLLVDIILPDSEVAIEERCALEQKLGIVQEAGDFREKMKDVLASKEATVQRAFDGLDLPRDVASLEYIDPRVPIRKAVPLNSLG